ncbi:MAG: SGNH/GDSL hydrolase family protein [Elusimicrobia bacterium]|nr:SGNH/GDSL hydrolase family protein [Elusimicrobiota bacterium]
MHPHRRETQLAAITVAVSLAAAALVLEGVARLFFRNEVDTAALREAAAAPSVVPFVRRVADPDLLYDLEPGARVLGWGGIRIEVDPSGCCRVIPGRRADEKGELRVAILGDSTPFGWKVPFEQSYGEQLRPLLERALRRTVALRNFAVPGYNSQQNRITLRDKVLPWRPHLVILHYDHNDSEPIDDASARFLYPEYGDNALHSALIKLARRRWRRLGGVRTTFVADADPARPEKSLQGYRYAGPQWEHHFEELRALAGLAAAARVPVIAFIWDPWLKRNDDPGSDPFYTLLHRPAAERLGAMGLHVADSYGLYQDYMRRGGRKDLAALWVSAADAHPNAEGHRLIARYLLGEALRQLRGARPRIAR